MQYTVLNGVRSDILPVTTKGSVLGPTLFTLFANDIPAAISEGELYMYADDTSIYCIGENADVAVAALNNALLEVQRWCFENRLTPLSRMESSNKYEFPRKSSFNSTRVQASEKEH